MIRSRVFESSSSPAGESPVQVVAREPGSRLAASGGNVRRRSPASKATWWEQPSGPQHEAKPAAASAQPRKGIKGEPSREYHGEGHGRREEPGSAAPRNPPP